MQSILSVQGLANMKAALEIGGQKDIHVTRWGLLGSGSGVWAGPQRLVFPFKCLWQAAASGNFNSHSQADGADTGSMGSLDSVGFIFPLMFIATKIITAVILLLCVEMYCKCSQSTGTYNKTQVFKFYHYKNNLCLPLPTNLITTFKIS